MILWIFSDETTVQNDSCNPNSWVCRQPWEKYDKDLVNPTEHVKPAISIMFWAAIWLEDRTWLIEMFGDPKSRRGGISSRSYQDALKEGLLPHFDGSRRFQQDNSRVHTSRSTQSWLRSHGIEPIYWPPYSPDLNPIENVWRMLKRKLRIDHPELVNLQDNEEDRAKFVDWVEDAWAHLGQDKIRKIIESMERRLRAVIRARGWYTKY